MAERMKKHPQLDNAIRKQKKRGVPVLENTIHAQIAQYLNLVIKRPSRWHTVEVSNQAQGRAAMIRQMQLKKRGVVTGWPDIEIFWYDQVWYNVVSNTYIGSFKIIFLEVKIPGGQLTEKQAALHQELRGDGHSVYVVHSVDEVQSVLKELGVI